VQWALQSSHVIALLHDVLIDEESDTSPGGDGSAPFGVSTRRAER